MAARWQQWMPFHIDKFKSSPGVRAMHPAARSGYLYLLAYAWQTEDCTVPSDPIELAEISELGDELWQTYGARILRKFTVIGATGRLQNDVCFEEWQEAKRKFEANSKAKAEAGRRGARARWNDGKAMAPAIKSDGKKCHTGTGTLTGTETEDKKQKPSRRQAASDDGQKHSTDPRHAGCKERIFAAYRHMNGGANPDWDGREGKALGMLLRAQPELNQESINPLLAHWARSDVNHGDRPSIWIPKLSSFRVPIDRFNKPKETGNGQQRTGKGHSIVEAAESAIRDLAGEAVGNLGDGEAGQRGFGNVEVLRSQPLGLPAAGSAQRDRPTLPYRAAGGGNRIP